MNMECFYPGLLPSETREHLLLNSPKLLEAATGIAKMTKDYLDGEGQLRIGSAIIFPFNTGTNKVFLCTKWGAVVMGLYEDGAQVNAYIPNAEKGKSNVIARSKSPRLLVKSLSRPKLRLVKTLLTACFKAHSQIAYTICQAYQGLRNQTEREILTTLRKSMAGDTAYWTLRVAMGDVTLTQVPPLVRETITISHAASLEYAKQMEELEIEHKTTVCCDKYVIAMTNSGKVLVGEVAIGNVEELTGSYKEVSWTPVFKDPLKLRMYASFESLPPELYTEVMAQLTSYKLHREIHDIPRGFRFMPSDTNKLLPVAEQQFTALGASSYLSSDYGVVYLIINK